jgi:polyisoprenoid-binding protein YceI
MKLQTRILPVVLVALTAASQSWAADYKIDPSHSHVGFGVKHMISRVKGQFTEFDGDFSFDPTKPTASTGKFVVKTASVSTENAKRDEHLKSGDFFDVKKFPEMTFDKIKIKPAKGKDRYKMTGELTLHGVTKPVSLDLEYTGTAKDPWGNTRVGFSADGKINRKDFGIVWNKTLDAGGMLLGDDVAIDLQVEAVQNTAEAPKAKSE